MKRYLITGIIGSLLLAGAALLAVVWFTFRIYVPEDRCAVLIRKSGQALPDGQLVATQPGQKGIQAEVLGPGRHFRNPYTFDWELQPQTVISSGDPSSWEWIHSLDDRQRQALRVGKFQFKGKFPEIGVVTRKVGPQAPGGELIVDRSSNYKGILREVLTPGTYKINPYMYAVERHPAVVIPAGFVGVVTNLLGDPAGGAAPAVPGDAPAVDSFQSPTSEPGGGADYVHQVRALAELGQRGTLRDVLQPGVYFINPKLQKVMLIEIGFNEYSQVQTEAGNQRISFPSDTGYLIQVGVTVVWGIDPSHAAETINEFGNVDRVLEQIIGPQLRSICRNIGSTYAARDFIHGEKREQFQREVTTELMRVCRQKNLEILLCLVREIEVHAPGATEGTANITEDLKRTIQESYIAIENQQTKEKQREAATVKAQLEEVRKQVDIAREGVSSDTRVKVAQILADAQKLAAQTDAQAALEVAQIQQQVAELEAKRTEILGQARADVEKMKKGAEADGYRMLVEAFGSPQAYNLYTFAEGFQPKSIQLFFAGEGTFWTDLKRFEELGAAKVMQQSPPQK